MTSQETARFTWHDLAQEDSLLRHACTLQDLSRDALPFGDTAMRRYVSGNRDVGGILTWNESQDPEHGHLFMLFGQTAQQERQVMQNAGWMVSAGAVYSARRVGVRGYKAEPHFRVVVEGDSYLVWLLFNDRDVDGTVTR